MSQEAAQRGTVPETPMPGCKPEDVAVAVSFPLAGKAPYKHEFAPETTADVVRLQAMAHFGVADDHTARYYLTHKGDPVEPHETVGAIARKSESVKFTLAKELIQG